MQDLDHYKCWADLQDPKVPEKALLDWWCSGSDDRQYHCVFCGDHGNYSHFLNTISIPDPGDPKNYHVTEQIFGCGMCKEYKGIEPCIPGYCLFGEE